MQSIFNHDNYLKYLKYLNINYIALGIGIIILLLLLFKFYIRIKFKFWSIQPVFHYHNLLYWIHPVGIINRKLPKTNRYCNFLNVNVTSFEERKPSEIDEIIGLLQGHYYRSEDGNYFPTLSSFSSYFVGNNSKTFISTYYKFITLLNNNNLTRVRDKQLLGVMTTRPINITLKKNITFPCYYVDYLCVHGKYRKKGIAPEIIQSHEYIQRHQNKKVVVSLFKREGQLTGIVPLTSYKTYQFVVSNIIRRGALHAKMNFIEINKLSLHLFVNFIYSQKDKFDCFALPDIANLINLITNNTYKIYAIVEKHNLTACYIFRNTHMQYVDGKAIEIFASISNCASDLIFINGFMIALYKYSKSLRAKLITIENISHNYKIIDYILSLNISAKAESPTAYFFYNYSMRQFLSQNVLLIC